MGIKRTLGILAWGALCSGAIGVSAEKLIKIEIDKPGTFEKRLPANKIKDGENLRLRGTLNNDDLRHLRYLCGSDTALKPTGRRLGILDLSEISFASSQRPFINLPNGNIFRVTSSQKLPEACFAHCDLDEVILPTRLDSIGKFAFTSSALKRIKIPADVVVDQYVLYGDTLLRELEWSVPPVRERLGDNQLQSLRKVVFNNVDYLPGGLAMGSPELEEIEVNGPLMHFDGTFVIDCPKLRRITFNGPVISSTNGLASGCPELEEVVFNAPLNFLPQYWVSDCPKFRGVRVNAPVMESGDTTVVADKDAYLAWAGMKNMVSGLLKRASSYNNDHSDFMPLIAVGTLKALKEIASELGMEQEAAACDSIACEMKELDVCLSKLELLKRSAPYKPDAMTAVEFRYAAPDDSLLTLTRERFNLDSIAGSGNDISRMKNLLYWIHDLIRHDGSSNNPDCNWNLRDMYDVCQRDNRGVNCRMMAIGLTEALLSVGIPARYLTCQSKAWATDSDCHVICVAWSDSLNKWVWLDPTFAAYVTDEKGMLLYPGEVRERLQKDLPVILNEDANWNHESPETADHYLNYYMAKNLYIISANLLNQAEPEGPTTHEKGRVVALVPQESDFKQAHILTTDPDRFWQAPSAER